jgi:predicted GNAT family acetyltransferase
MGSLEPHTPDLNAEVADFLRYPAGLHLYLQDRLEAGTGGRSFVYCHRGRVRGFAFLGDGQNFVLAGDDQSFLRDLAAFAAANEKKWQLVLGPWSEVTDFLDLYRRRCSRKARLDRTQAFMVQTSEGLPSLREPALRLATADDLDTLSGASARMSAEDFELDLYLIDREKVRAGLAKKVAADRSFVLAEGGEVIFKADLSVLSPLGGQVEGVFTTEDRRGRGIASRCMTEIGRRLLGKVPMLTLHVAADNTAAFRAYEKAGYRREAELRLAIYPYVR